MTPKSWYSTAFWLAIEVEVKIAAVPNPMNTMATARNMYGVEPFICAIATSPPIEQTDPIIGNFLYLPDLEISRPSPNVAMVTPSIWGKLRRPDSVGETNSES